MKKLAILFAFSLAACGKTAAPADPLEVAARRTCMDTIESRAINRNSITYTSDDPPMSKDAKGQLKVAIKFSAKNEIGMASALLAQCTVSSDGKALVDIAVKDSL
jgi:hypothetical protein